MVVKIKLIALVFFIFFSNYSYCAQKFQIIRDAEIEFFLHKLIDSTIDDKINQNFKPRLVLNNEYNAFVTGSDKIYVNTGLIVKSNSLSEIQAILAHEIGHLALNHYNTRLVNTKNLSNYSKFATLAGIALAGSRKLNADTALGLIVGSSDLANKYSLQFSRIQEQQADKYALEQMIKRKISLTGLENLLSNLVNEERFNANKDMNYYRSHPFSKQRLDQVKRYKLKYQKISLKEQRVLINDNIISLQYIKNKIYAYSNDPYKIIKDLENKHDFLSNYSQVVALYRIGKYDFANKKFAEIKSKYKDYPFFYELRGDIYFKNGNFVGAINEYKKAIQTIQKTSIPVTDIIKFSLIKTYLQTKTKTDLNKSVNLLEELIQNNPNWSYLWRLLSKASGKLNQKGVAYIALAEEALIKKNFIKAKKYVDMANRQANLPPNYKFRGSDILARVRLNKAKNN